MLDQLGNAYSEDMLLAILCQYATAETTPEKSANKADVHGDLEHAFLTKASGTTLSFPAKDILDLGRASYRLRDDDNIYLGNIEKQLARAVVEGKNRIMQRGEGIPDDDPVTLMRMLRGKHAPSSILSSPQKTLQPHQPDKHLRARQLTGQPASKGIAHGACRLINTPDDIAAFIKGEILVVDSIDPNMTFIAPLAAAIIERRGAMLIHGAIIAREYGIPCVTGVPEAMQLLENGTSVTVDGYLGL